MKHWIKLVVALRFSLLITSFVLVPIRSAAGEELDAKNILKGLQLRIAPPSQYRVKLGSFESVVSTKVLPSGVVAVRVEAAAPSQTAVIIRGGEYFDVLNQSKVVIHKSQMDLINFPKEYLCGNELSKSFIAQHPDAAHMLGQSVALDRGSYLVTVTFSGPSIEGLDLESSPLGKNVVRKEVWTVGVENLEPIRLQQYAFSGQLIRQFDYSEVVANASLDDDMFSVTLDGFSDERPATIAEYFDLHKKFWREIEPTPKFDLIFPPIVPRVKPIATRLEGKEMIPVPEGSSLDEMKQLIEAEKKKRVPLVTAIPASRLSSRVFLFGSLSVFLAGALLVLWKKIRVRGD